MSKYDDGGMGLRADGARARSEHERGGEGGGGAPGRGPVAARMGRLGPAGQLDSRLATAAAEIDAARRGPLEQLRDSVAAEAPDLRRARVAAGALTAALDRIDAELADAEERIPAGARSSARAWLEHLRSERDALRAEAAPLLARQPPTAPEVPMIDGWIPQWTGASAGHVDDEAEVEQGWRARLATGGGGEAASAPQAVADAGVAGAGAPLPHRDAIAASFGHHDVSGISAHIGGAAADAAGAMGAEAYATRDRVGFASAPDLFTAAHEAAHVIQQRAGVALLGGVGAAGDAHEEHADAVADRVVRGESAADVLDDYRGGGDGGGGIQLQRTAGASTKARSTRDYGDLLLAQAYALARRAFYETAGGRDDRDPLLTAAAHAARRYLDGLAKKPPPAGHHPQLRGLAAVLGDQAARMKAGGDPVQVVVERLTALGFDPATSDASARPTQDDDGEKRLIREGFRRVDAALRRAIATDPANLHTAVDAYDKGAATAAKDLIVVADALDVMAGARGLKKVKKRFASEIKRLRGTVDDLHALVRASRIPKAPSIAELYRIERRILTLSGQTPPARAFVSRDANRHTGDGITPEPATTAVRVGDRYTQTFASTDGRAGGWNVATPDEAVSIRPAKAAAHSWSGTIEGIAPGSATIDARHWAAAGRSVATVKGLGANLQTRRIHVPAQFEDHATILYPDDLLRVTATLDVGPHAKIDGRVTTPAHGGGHLTTVSSRYDHPTLTVIAEAGAVGAIAPALEIVPNGKAPVIVPVHRIEIVPALAGAPTSRGETDPKRVKTTDIDDAVHLLGLALEQLCLDQRDGVLDAEALLVERATRSPLPWWMPWVLGGLEMAIGLVTAGVGNRLGRSLARAVGPERDLAGVFDLENAFGSAVKDKLKAIAKAHILTKLPNATGKTEIAEPAAVGLFCKSQAHAYEQHELDVAGQAINDYAAFRKLEASAPGAGLAAVEAARHALAEEAERARDESCRATMRGWLHLLSIASHGQATLRDAKTGEPVIDDDGAEVAGTDLGNRGGRGHMTLGLDIDPRDPEAPARATSLRFTTLAPPAARKLVERGGRLIDLGLPYRASVARTFTIGRNEVGDVWIEVITGAMGIDAGWARDAEAYLYAKGTGRQDAATVSADVRRAGMYAGARKILEDEIGGRDLKAIPLDTGVAVP
jgi:hypothetical protein